MFKRVEKKLAKKKNEEELGFTEEIKEVIGLNDVDSNDSSSDETDASGSTSSPRLTSKRKRLLDDELGPSSDAASEGQGSGASDDPEDDDEDEPGVQMTVEEVLHDPLYIISLQPDIRGCIVCPQKLLKNDTMASVHTNSQVCRAHSSNLMAASRRLFSFCPVGSSATDIQVQGSGCICKIRRRRSGCTVRRFHSDSVATKTTFQWFRSPVKPRGQTSEHEPTTLLNFGFSHVR